MALFAQTKIVNESNPNRSPIYQSLCTCLLWHSIKVSICVSISRTSELKSFICRFKVTGVNIHVITPIICVVCVFYTCAVNMTTLIMLVANRIIFVRIFLIDSLQGGLKAVVWTDVVQTFSMFGALILVAVKGSMDLGGPSVVFKDAWHTGRIEAPM